MSETFTRRYGRWAIDASNEQGESYNFQRLEVFSPYATPTEGPEKEIRLSLDQMRDLHLLLGRCLAELTDG